MKRLQTFKIDPKNSEISAVERNKLLACEIVRQVLL